MPNLSKDRLAVGPHLCSVSVLGTIEHVQARVIDKAQPESEAPDFAGRELLQILDTIPQHVLVSDGDGNLLYVNQMALDYFAKTSDSIRTRQFWRRVCHPEDFEALTESRNKSLADGVPGEITARLLRTDERYRWFLIRSRPVRTEEGRIVRWYETQTDMDEQVRSEEHLQDALDATPVLIHSARSDGSLDYFNKGWLEYLGVSLNDIKDWKWTSRIHPSDIDALVEKWRACVKTGELFEGESRVRRADGSYRWMLHRKVPVRDRNGTIIKWFGSSIDIEERKRDEDALKRSTEELRRREAYLSEAQRLSHTGSFGWNVITGERTWSEENFRILGYDRSIKPTFELFRDRVHPEDRQMWEEAFARASEGKQVDFEHRLLMPDGTVKFLHTVAYGVQKDGKFVELVGTVRDITERKQAEEAIRRSEAYLAEAQKLSHTGSWAWSPDTGARYWSDECYRVLGFDPRDGPPRTEELIQRIHPDDQQAFRESAERAAAHNKSDEEVDYRIVHPGGAVRDIHSIGHPVFSPRGDLIEYTGTVIDITERKRAEEELRASEAKYRHLVDTTPAFIRTALPNGDVDFFNRGWLEYVGLPLTDLLGWRWTCMIHPDDVETIVPKLRSAFEAGKPFVGELRVRRADGQYRWFLHRSEPLRNEAGEIVKWYGSSIEIEERKIAEEAIRLSEAFLAEGQRLSSTGSWGWNASTGKLTWSQEHFRILGLDPEDTSPSQDVFWERVHPDDRTRAKRAFESAIRDKKNFELEFRIVTPDWSIRHLHGVGHAVLNKADELVEFIGSSMDITERKRAEERAQSQREAIRLALNAFVEELDVNHFLADVIAELNKQFHAKSWELWLFDEAINALLLHSASDPRESLSARLDSKNARSRDEFQSIWQTETAAREAQVVQLLGQESLLSRQRCESLKARGIETLMVVPLALGEQSLGFLELHFQSPTQFTADDLELAQALVNHATLALQLNRLTRRAEQLAVTEERNRLAREIHDTLAQAFAGIVLHSEALRNSLAVSKRRSANALSHIQKLARSGLDEARRSVQALRPKALEGSTLSGALKQAAKRLAEGRKLSCQFRQRGETQILSLEAQNELFRIAQEALTNVSKHAEAKSVWIDLRFASHQVALTIRDNGVGLTATTSKEPKRGYGLATMRERAQRIGGQLEVQSPKNGGLSIRVRVPLATSEEPINIRNRQ